MIVTRYAGAARGAAYLLLGRYEDALDASQEAFVRAWRGIRRFNPEAPFYPWYSRILRNVCISRLRRRPAATHSELSEASSPAKTDSDPVLIAELNEQRERIWRAIMELPLHHREIIVMQHFQEMSYRDIAASLNIPIGTVMSRLHNARQALRRKLTGEKP